MSTNVGEIDLELLLNSNKFNKQLGNVQNIANKSGNLIASSLKKTGVAALGAFSVKKIVSFSKECINLGSDIAEVQNVVDVAFKTMNGHVNNFASTAVEQFGLSQLATKKYMGTFGAMSNAFGFTEKKAYEMSKTLTGLAGDVASFYNLSSDEAYTKLKSVFTGETETLKDLGVVMTQSALDQYALANGFGKTTAKMSEQEKVALRYNFVLKQLDMASGDFLRTQDSWANQTRILSLRFDELKASLGQGLINLFTPLLKVINQVLAKLQVLANSFKSFTDMITGNVNSNNGSGFSALADSAVNVSSAVDSIGDSATKAKKKLNGLRNFDVLNNITTSNKDSGSGSGNIDIGSNIDFDNINSSSNAFDNLITKVKEPSNIVEEGFQIGFGDFNFDRILDHVLNIKNAIIDIGTDKDVINSAMQFGDTFLYSLGKIAGSVSRIGKNIVEFLVGSIDFYLDEWEDKIKGHICNMFDISSADMELTSNFWQSLGEISDVFSSDEAKQIGADIIAMIVNPLMSARDICFKFGVDLKALLFKPIINNTNKIKTAFNNFLRPLQKVTSTLATAWTYIGDKWNEVYDNAIHPFMDHITNGISDTVSKILDAYNTYMAPFLNNIANDIGILWEEHIRPLADTTAEFFQSISEYLQVFFEQQLKPAIDWIVENVIPVVVPILEKIWNTTKKVFGDIIDAVKGVIKIFKGCIDFVTGVFSGDWNKAWEGIKTIFSGIWEAIGGLAKAVWDNITGTIGIGIENLKGIINIGLQYIKDYFWTIWNGIAGAVSTVWDNIKNFAIRGAEGTWNGIKNVFGSVGNWFKDTFSRAWENVKNVFCSGGRVFDGIKDGIESTFKTVVNKLISGINRVIKIPFDKIKDALNKIRNIEIAGYHPFYGLPYISAPSIPYLAQGGYFKANQPTLAMVGDNMTQDEVVTPVPKMQDALRTVLNEQKGNTEIVNILKQILNILKNLGGDIILQVGDEELAKAVIRGARALQAKSSTPIFDFI